MNSSNAASTNTDNLQNIQLLQPPAPFYIPTPKHILEARKASIEDDGTTPTSKKPKLEYVPQAKTPSNNLYPIPTYVPSTVSNVPAAINPSVNAIEQSNINGNDSNGDDISGILTELSTDQNNDLEEILNDNSEIKLKSPCENGTVAEKHRRHSSNSTSSSRSQSSRSDRDKKVASSRKHTSKDKSPNHKTISSSSGHKSSKTSSSASSSHRSSSSSKSKHKDKSKSSHSSSSSSKHKSSSSDKEHRKTSSSSSSHKRSSSHSDSKHRKHSKDEKSENSKSQIEDVVYDIDSDFDDGDVEAECRMIFEEFDPSTIKPATSEITDDRRPSIESDDVSSDDVNKRKRVAHENADKQFKPLQTFQKTSNHVQNAMQVSKIVEVNLI